VRYPREDIEEFGAPGAAPTYRGLHANDLSVCVGCGTCEEICTTSAIAMVPGSNTGAGKKGVVPRIDYGRCCFCGFCVEMCTSGSLTMSRDYIHTVENPLDKAGLANVRAVMDAVKITPDEKRAGNPGHTVSDDRSWLDLDREPMEQLGASERVRSFAEVLKGYSREAAQKEASRCVECEICVDTCPAHMEVPKYIRAIWEGDLERAVEIMYETNPLPAICGRVCTHKCESVCSISLRGEPVAIRWLKRYAVDQLPDDEYRAMLLRKQIAPRPEKVAIVGSGPAGLSAAYYLSLAGIKAVVYEALPRAGGMLRVGAPSYRMPEAALDRELSLVTSLGAEIRCGQRVGVDVSFDELAASYDAVFVSTGLHKGRALGFAAERLPAVHQSIDLLRRARLEGDLPVPRRIVVIGGGNVAMDIARTCARLQMAKYGEVQIDVACLESREEIPADLLTEGDKVTGAAFKRCVSVFDGSGRFAPKFDETDRMTLAADWVIESIGQQWDLDYIPREIMESIEKTPRRQLAVTEDGQTSVPWLFAGGDIVHGPDIIHGVADGHAAARGIERYLDSRPV
jgi:glutamate synthase (NADPH/NADH) small chain